MVLYLINKESVVLWCLLSSVFSVPTSVPQNALDQVYTTSRPIKTIVQFNTHRPLSLQIGNSGGGKTTIIESSKSPTTMIKTTATTTTIPKIKPPRVKPLYRLDAINGKACILLQVDAVISVEYKTKSGEQLEANIYVPSDATVTGNCDAENYVTMSLKWKAFVLTWSFAKTPGGERWYVDKIELTYNSSDRHFTSIDQPNKTVRLSSDKTTLLFPTPVGKSYVCEDEVKIPLTDGKNKADVFLREMKLQPFKFKDNKFASEFSCKLLSARAGRDETAPIAVGSTLAAAVLLTISGYAGWRYFKVKKVKYDTME
ncbi:hypothetical protein HCN44_006405 [Aphidius gifuensis]|uniref:Lysosome-associated membrane glycoprotein 2-like luminal domain-containing protein n=1 Tax=Aphidius gifuensis TaxID=684658 RepID=A0A834XTT5_APHGI|nr:lysosome-associated membrane glycoprotein 5 [Aphidius gifuensis]KAF7993345.1 hypothetical protein HCN44_006405 [Aphidius gifuensis]